MCTLKTLTNLFPKTKNKNRKYFCKSCLQCFSSKNVLTEHKEDCLIINGKQSVKLEKGTIEFDLKEYKYCKKVMKKHFNKNLIMREEENLFQQSNSSWICEKLIDNDEKVRDHCHITGQFRGAAHWSCNINLQLTKKFPVIFHNLKCYDSHLIFCELNKCHAKIRVIPNGLEKYMAFFGGKNLVFIDSMQFTNFSLDKLVKNLSDEDFKYSVEEFGSKNLELLKEKGAYLYEYMNSFERFNEKKKWLLENIFRALQKTEKLEMMVKNQTVT